MGHVSEICPRTDGVKGYGIASASQQPTELSPCEGMVLQNGSSENLSAFGGGHRDSQAEASRADDAHLASMKHLDAVSVAGTLGC
jgi:hypothetical protein